MTIKKSLALNLERGLSQAAARTNGDRHSMKHVAMTRACVLMRGCRGAAFASIHSSTNPLPLPARAALLRSVVPHCVLLRKKFMNKPPPAPLASCSHSSCNLHAALWPNRKLKTMPH
jgi:hypothetical protein